MRIISKVPTLFFIYPLSSGNCEGKEKTLFMLKFYLRKMLLTVVMLLCSVAVSAQDFEMDGIYYNITSEKTVEVTYCYYEKKYNGSVIIPSKVNFIGKSYTVTKIGQMAFRGCNELTSVTIPGTVTEIDDYAFDFCTSLKNIVIPEGVTTIGRGAFVGCKDLENVIFPNSLKMIKFDGAMIEHAFNNTKWFSNQPNGVVYAGNVLYAYKGTIPINTSVEIKIGTVSIAEYAFHVVGYDCGDNIVKITIPESVTIIGQGAFYNCSALTSIYLMGTTPPFVDSDNFTNSNYINTTVYVPKGSFATYQAADVWKTFGIFQEYEITGIGDVNVSNVAIEVTAGGITLSAAEGKRVAVYSASGALVEKIDSYAGEEIALEKGVYIVRIGNAAIKVKL